MVTQPPHNPDLSAVAELAAQNRRDINALVEQMVEFSTTIRQAVEAMAEQMADAYARFVQQVTQAAEEDRAKIAALTDNVATLTNNVATLQEAVATLTVAQVQTTARLDDLTEQQAQTNARLDDLTEQQAQTNTRLDDLTEQQAQTNTRLDDLTEQQAQTNTRLDDLTEQQAQTNASLAEHKTETTARFDALTDALAQTNAHLSTLSGHVANISGSRYEQHAARLASRHIRRRLQFSKATVSHKAWQPGAIIDDAADSDRITDAEADQLSRVDLLIGGLDQHGQPAHVAAEISVTIQERDVTRAAQRARILRRVIGQTTVAAVIGADIADDARQSAQRQEVTYIAIADQDD